MLRNLICILIFFVFLINRCVAQDKPKQEKEIMVDHSSNIHAKYDCIFYQDTLHLVVFYFNYKDISTFRNIYHYKIHRGIKKKINELNNKVLKGEKVIGPTYLPKFKLSNELKLVVVTDSNDYIRLIDLKNGINRPVHKNKIKPDFEFYSNEKTSFIIYAESYWKFVIGLTDISREYRKNYIIKIDSNKISKPEIIQQESRIFSRGLKGVLSKDTLYVVWQERKKNSFRWIDFIPTGYSNEILFSKYDGKQWTEPLVVVEDNEPKDIIESLIGLYRINNKFFVFWTFHKFLSEEKESKYEAGIYYKWSYDLKNWSPLMKIKDNIGNFIVAQCSTNKNIHLLSKEKENSTRTNYSIFDGEKLLNLGIVIDEESYYERIILDNENNVYIFWRSYESDELKVFKVPN